MHVCMYEYVMYICMYVYVVMYVMVCYISAHVPANAENGMYCVLGVQGICAVHVR